MYLYLCMILSFCGLLTHHGLEGLSMAARPEVNQSTSDSSYIPFQSSVSPKLLESQLPQMGISCEDLMPEALENFSNVSRLPQIIIRAALTLALQSAGCRKHADSSIVHLHRALGEREANALLRMMTNSLGTAKSHHQNRSRSALEFNLEQLSSKQALHCKGLTPIKGAFLHGQVHRVYRGFQSAATACHRLGPKCAGVSFNNNNFFQVMERKGSYFLPHHGAHSWLHQCRSHTRNRRSTIEEGCVHEKERKAHAILEWIPVVSTLYNFGTSIYYATQDCTDLAKERALDGALDLGYDAIMAATGGASGWIGLALQPGVKLGGRYLINYFQ